RPFYAKTQGPDSTVIDTLGASARSGASDVDTKIFQLDIIIDAVFRAFTSLAGLLDPAKGCHFGRYQAGVNADHAIFQCFGDLEDPGDVPCIEIGSEAEFGIIGQFDDFVIVFKAEEGSDRPENLLPRD